MIHSLGDAAQEAGRCVVFLIDELQYLDSEELSALIMAKHRVNQWRLPIVFAGVGLPQLPALTSEAQTYAERMFAWPKVGRLEARDAAQALVIPARAEGVEYTDAAIDFIVSYTSWTSRFRTSTGTCVAARSHGRRPLCSGVPVAGFLVRCRWRFWCAPTRLLDRPTSNSELVPDGREQP